MGADYFDGIKQNPAEGNVRQSLRGLCGIILSATGAGGASSSAPKEQQQVLQQLMQKRNARDLAVMENFKGLAISNRHIKRK